MPYTKPSIDKIPSLTTRNYIHKPQLDYLSTSLRHGLAAYLTLLAIDTLPGPEVLRHVSASDVLAKILLLGFLFDYPYHGTGDWHVCLLPQSQLEGPVHRQLPRHCYLILIKFELGVRSMYPSGCIAKLPGRKPSGEIITKLNTRNKNGMMRDN